ncbi:MAG: KH domain-containing protein [Coriobacteriales bacterium]|jgi:predicted RNA-binding protein YlqC (UPF0109 family)
MPKQEQATVELVEHLVRSLVDNQDAVKISSSTSANELMIEVSVADEETGKVIGRQGRIIKAIRTLARASAGYSVEVEVLG